MSRAWGKTRLDQTSPLSCLQLRQGGIVYTDITSSDSYSSASDLVVLGNDRFVVGGSVFRYSSETSDFALVEYHPGGHVDTSFGNGDGIVTTDFSGLKWGGPDDSIAHLKLAPSGRLVAVGPTWSGNVGVGVAEYWLG